MCYRMFLSRLVLGYHSAVGEASLAYKVLMMKRDVPSQEHAQCINPTAKRGCWLEGGFAQRPYGAVIHRLYPLLAYGAVDVVGSHIAVIAAMLT